MGGCCCCSSKGPERHNTPEYRYLARTLEENVPSSSLIATASSLSTGLLVDTNLETSFIDTYRPPPPPRPYNVDLGNFHSPPSAQEICGNKSDASAQTVNSESVDERVDGSTTELTAKCENLKESDCKAQSDFELDSEKKQKVKLSELGETIALAMEEDDVCPICLEEYDVENPKLTTKCEHHYHLACILEWMERSDTCPVCDQEMIFSPPING